MVSYHPTKLVGHRHHVSRDIMVFVCHVTLEDHVAIATLFGGHSHFGSGVMISVCHAISQDHVIKG